MTENRFGTGSMSTWTGATDGQRDLCFCIYYIYIYICVCVCVSVVCHQRPDMRITDTHQPPPPPPRAAGPSLFFSNGPSIFQRVHNFFSSFSNALRSHERAYPPPLSLYVCTLFVSVHPPSPYPSPIRCDVINIENRRTNALLINLLQSGGCRAVNVTVDHQRRHTNVIICWRVILFGECLEIRKGGKVISSWLKQASRKLSDASLFLKVAKRERVDATTLKVGGGCNMTFNEETSWLSTLYKRTNWARRTRFSNRLVRASATPNYSIPIWIE